MDIEQVKQEINEEIRYNGQKLITGDKLNKVLNDMMDAAGEAAGTAVEANPNGASEDVLSSIKIAGRKYTIRESESGDEREIVGDGTLLEHSTLDLNMVSINHVAGNASLLFYPISGYTRLKITPKNNLSAYLCITRIVLSDGNHSNTEMVNDNIVVCPGYVPNNGNNPQYRMRIPAGSDPVEITLTPDAKYLYVQHNFVNGSDITPDSIIAFSPSQEGEGGGGNGSIGLEVNSGNIGENGQTVADEETFYTSPISLASGFFVRLNQPYRVKRAVMYDNEDNMVDYYDLAYTTEDYDGKYLEWGLNVILPQYYLRLVLEPKDDSRRLTKDQVVRLFVRLDDSRLSRVSPVNSGDYPVTDAQWKLFQRRIKQVIDPVWMALEAVPRSDNYFRKGTINRGVPYSEAAEYNKYVGNQVAFRTFLTALLNKRSLIYTEDISKNQNVSKYGISYKGMSTAARSYYGTVCTGLTSYVLGLEDIVVSYQWPSIPTLEAVAKGTHTSKWQVWDGANFVTATPDDIWALVGPMDIVFNTGHCSLISDVFNDEDDEKSLVCWAEQTTPRGKITPFSKEGLLKRLDAITEVVNSDTGSDGGYKQWMILRNTAWADMDDNYGRVRFDEEAETPYIQTKVMDYTPAILDVDPDIQMAAGEYAAFGVNSNGYPTGTPFFVNIHRNKGKFNTLQIFGENDDPEIDTPVEIDISSNVTGYIYNSTIYDDDAADKDDWIIVDLRQTGTPFTAGQYKARVVGQDAVSGFTHFEVVELDFTYDSGTKVATFSTTGGTPYLFRLEKADGMNKGSWAISAADEAAGYKTLTGISPDSTYNILKLLVAGDYGVVVTTLQL